MEKCDRIKKLLSEYIDGVLDAQTGSLVEEHLLECKDCKDERDALNTLIKGLGALDTVKPPGDFLERVHERVKGDSLLEKIKRLLFIPARIKIPVEMAALATTAVLVFIVFSLIQPGSRITDTHPGAGDSRERTPIQLALSLEPGTKEEPISSENVVFVTSGSGMERKAPPEFLFRADPHEGELVDQDGSVEKEKPSSVQPDEAVTRIKEISSFLNGKILSVEYEEGTGVPGYITAEIPVTKYHTFLQRIERMGTFQSPTPSLKDKELQRILIRVQIIP